MEAMDSNVCLKRAFEPNAHIAPGGNREVLKFFYSFCCNDLRELGAPKTGRISDQMRKFVQGWRGMSG